MKHQREEDDDVAAEADRWARRVSERRRGIRRGWDRSISIRRSKMLEHSDRAIPPLDLDEGDYAYWEDPEVDGQGDDEDQS